jgi:hypothetical protein
MKTAAVVMQAPQDLVLGVEPQANVIRYDSLREKRHAA